MRERERERSTVPNFQPPSSSVDHIGGDSRVVHITSNGRAAEPMKHREYEGVAHCVDQYVRRQQTYCLPSQHHRSQTLSQYRCNWPALLSNPSTSLQSHKVYSTWEAHPKACLHGCYVSVCVTDEALCDSGVQRNGESTFALSKMASSGAVWPVYTYTCTDSSFFS